MNKLPDFIAEKIQFEPMSGCWLWSGYGNGHGYGSIQYNSIRWLAHRLVYSIMVGDIGSFYCCHKCDNTYCVNPGHIFLGTAKQNVADSISKKRFKIKVNRCKNGHEYTPENTYYFKPVNRGNLSKFCRKCRIIRNSAYRNRLKDISIVK